jgi:hypothetical protein
VDVEMAGDRVSNVFAESWILWHVASRIVPFNDFTPNNLPTGEEHLHNGNVQLEELEPRFWAMTEFNFRHHDFRGVWQEK